MARPVFDFFIKQLIDVLRLISVHGHDAFHRKLSRNFWLVLASSAVVFQLDLIQGLDLLGRKVVMNGGQALAVLGARITQTIEKATKVDGVYTDDPKKNPDAVRYQSLTFDEAIARNLKVMDATAFALCRDQQFDLKVFSIFKQGALKRVVLGEDEGTLVHC